MRRPAVVIDTNVLVVASERNEQASKTCILTCISTLRGIRENNVVIVDDGQRIFSEYFGKLSFSGQPGVGDSFFKWLFDNQGNERHCHFVSITPRQKDADDFVEFPNDISLGKFDRADRKFVAVAIASKNNPPIYNACDTDWHHFDDALKKHRVKVVQLCPELMS
ncbi:MAG: hypothetical protein HZA04_04000 [Nitrospinae bacterium]|nr:hypothetical protein [Nitrospinota bacterium]